MIRALSTASILSIVFLIGACSHPAEEVEITETSTRSETRPVPQVDASSRERFRLALGPESGPAPSGAGILPAQTEDATDGPDGTPAPTAAPDLPAPTLGFTYDVPEGWTEIAPTQFRNPNFRAGPNGNVEAYVSTLPGQAGGLLLNANRWRNQLAQPPYTEEEFAQLPRAAILNAEAVIVDFTGEFTGMGAAEAKPGYRLVGALIDLPMSSVFIKMVGPDEATNNEKDNFARFAQSLQLEAVGVQTGAAPEPPPSIAAPDSGGSIAWDVPEGWREVDSGSPMRAVTLRFGPNGVGECYVVALPGMAGGRLDNFNRWLAQMGQDPLEESELELQPTLTLFGEEVPMLIASGTYTGMGGEARPNHVLFGASGEIGTESVFVKFIAPEDLAAQQRDNFKAFCASLRRN